MGSVVFLDAGVGPEEGEGHEEHAPGAAAEGSPDLVGVFADSFTAWGEGDAQEHEEGREGEGPFWDLLCRTGVRRRRC